MMEHSKRLIFLNMQKGFMSTQDMPNQSPYPQDTATPRDLLAHNILQSKRIGTGQKLVTWRDIADGLGGAFSHGYLNKVYLGKAHASRRLLRKLRPTPAERFEANCLAYDIWRPSIEAQVAAMLLACEEHAGGAVA
jgi:hypothetical protein